MVKISDINGDLEESIYSSKMACSQCGYSIPELEPRLFTFNNPAGACSECEGLGVKPYVDVGKVIHEPSATISEGAIVGWDINNKYHYHLLRCLSNHYNFSLDEPFDQLSEEIKELILEGSKGEPVDFSWRSKRGKLVERIYSFEGVMTNINRRYKETDSNGVRTIYLNLLA